MPRQLQPTVDRRQSLIAAARTLIAERGFEGLRTRDVAQRVGLNHATLHHYFATKEALIEAVVRELVSELATYRTTLRAPELPAREAFRAYLVAARAQMRADPTPLIALGEFFRRAGRTPALAPIIRELNAGWNGFLTALLERGQREGDFRRDFDAATVARLLTTHLSGVRLPLLDKGATLGRE